MIKLFIILVLFVVSSFKPIEDELRKKIDLGTINGCHYYGYYSTQWIAVGVLYWYEVEVTALCKGDKHEQTVSYTQGFELAKEIPEILIDGY